MDFFTFMLGVFRCCGFEDLIPAGIVLTGGTSKMEGVVELAEEIFHMPVSIGKPKSVAGLSDIVRNPIYATSVGLLQYGLGNAPQSHGAHRSEMQSGSVWQSVKSWLLGQ